MRIIDADALIPMMKYATTDSEIGVFPIKIGFNAITEVINNASTIDAVPVVMIESRINGLKKMLIDIDSDDVDNIWALRTEIDTLTELLEMWAERKEE